MRKIISVGLAMCLAGSAFAQSVTFGLNEQERTRYKEYIVSEKRPATIFAPGFRFSIGATLPEEVEIYDVPAQPQYGYVIHETRPAWVDRRTRRVLQYVD